MPMKLIVAKCESKKEDDLQDLVKKFWASLFSRGNECLISLMFYKKMLSATEKCKLKCKNLQSACGSCYITFMRSLIDLVPMMRILCVARRGGGWSISANPFSGNLTWFPTDSCVSSTLKSLASFMPHFTLEQEGYCQNVIIYSCFRGDEYFWNYQKPFLILGLYYLVTIIASHGLIHDQSPALEKVVNFVGRKIENPAFAQKLNELISKGAYSHEAVFNFIESEINQLF